MATIFDVDPNKLIESAAEELKKVEAVKAPEWALFAKTGVHKERPPINPDWWQVRSAAVLRKLYKSGTIGVSKLRTYYGGKKDRGFKPEVFRKGSGSVIRKVLQQLEAAGFAETDTKSKHRGRKITSKGKSFLDKIASRISKEGAKPEAQKNE